MKLGRGEFLLYRTSVAIGEASQVAEGGDVIGLRPNQDNNNNNHNGSSSGSSSSSGSGSGSGSNNNPVGVRRRRA